MSGAAPLAILVMIGGVLVYLAFVAERRTDEHAPWRIPLMGARRTFPLRTQLLIFVLVVAGFVVAAALLGSAGLVSLPG